MIFTKAAEQILSCFPRGKDISGKAGIEVHARSPMKDDKHGQGRDYLTTSSVIGLSSGNCGSCFLLKKPEGLFKL